MGSCLPTNDENCESIRAWAGAVRGELVEPLTALRQACPEFIEGLRANGRKPIFETKVAKTIQRGIGRL
jgi:hypothetical protein